MPTKHVAVTDLQEKNHYIYMINKYATNIQI